MANQNEQRAAQTSGGAPFAEGPPKEDKSWIGVVFGLVAIAIAATSPLWQTKVYGDRGRAAAQAQVAALTASVASLQRRLEDVQIPAILVAAHDLKESMSRDEPFDMQLSLFRTVVGSGEDVRVIVAAAGEYAGKGVPSIKTLKSDFGAMAQRAMVASYPASEAGSLNYAIARVNAVASRISTMVVGADGAGVPATLGRAQARLAEGDLVGAVQELETLPPEAVTPEVETWIADAKSRLRLETVSADLNQLIVQRSRMAVAG